MAASRERRNTGRLFVIGGHEMRDGGGTVLEALVQAMEGDKIVVATLASEEPEAMWEMYDKAFRSHGVRHRHHLRIESRAGASSDRAIKTLQDAACVFFTGGDQLKITSLLGESAVWNELVRMGENGTVIAGTSAGAAAFSETMLVAGGAEESARVHSDLELAPGLGFAHGMVIDQHFAQRGRIGRLLGVIGLNPRMLCIGIDEDTAIDLRVDRDFTVVGEGGVTVLDGEGITHSGATEAETDRTMSLFGVRLHVLSQSDRYNLKDRRPRAAPHEEVERRLERGEGLRDRKTARKRPAARSRAGSSSPRSQPAGDSA